MSTTTEEMNKAAARLTARKKQGCVTYLKAAGKSDQEIAALLPKYAALDQKRTANLMAAREAIIPSK